MENLTALVAMQTEHLLEIAVSALIVIGAAFTFIGSLGLARLGDFYTRLHGPTKATTLGVGALLIASVIYFSTRGEGPSLHEVLVTVFLFITAPVSAHLLAKAALHLRVRSIAPPPSAVEGADAGQLRVDVSPADSAGRTDSS